MTSDGVMVNGAELECADGGCKEPLFPQEQDATP